MRDVDEYINGFPDEVKAILLRIRRIILDHVPDAEEDMAYRMPSYKTYGKPLVYFAGFKNHIGFYATPSGHSEFAEELSAYRHGKGSVQFPLDKPIPYDLVRRIVIFRAEENKRAFGEKKSR
jgi:uncharacterized protein YdhG (YjbR/CyaY superfamily)